ncbi:MAG: hypothetical protein ACI8Y4_004001 [Candidatus Poriferisodalaceae bacterium]|jgi:uncharacterized protein (TIGR02118 family)
MIKLMVGLRRRPDLTREEFQTYWYDTHPDAAGPALEGIKAMGALRYVQIHAIDETYNQRLGTARGGEDDFDGFAELWFESLDAFEEGARSDAGRAAAKVFLEDEKNFVDWSRTVIMVAEEKERFRADSYDG